MAKIDIIKDIGESRRYTLHSHTQFCDGHANMDAFARMAAAEGFTHYGYSPHSPIPVESSCNMSIESVPLYFDEVARIKDLYGDRVKFMASMEIDYIGPQWGPADDYFAGLDLDYAIGSVHFIPCQSGEYVDIDGSFARFREKMSEYFRGDIRYVVEKFYEHSCMMIEAGGFDIIGHFDKIGHNADHYQPGIESEGWYKSLVDDLMNLIIDKRLIVEINTKALAKHRRFFPSASLWQRLVDARVPIVVNSDAHQPELINAGRDEAYALLDTLRDAKPSAIITI